MAVSTLPPARLEPITLGDVSLTLDVIESVARGGAKVTLGPVARQRMLGSRAVVDAIARGGADAPSVYGINTGFGALAEVRISPAQVEELQRNLVRSHACGVGGPLPADATRALMLLRAQVLAGGYSGARPAVAELLCALLDKGVLPVIPAQGSVGASGDLAPLAHLALVLMGEGHAVVDGETLPGGKALERVGLAPVQLQAKEGITVLNGTQFMTAVGALACADALRLCTLADVIGALSLEGYRGTPRAFDPRIHAVRPHPGQSASARNLMRLLTGSGVVESHAGCGKVQDPYSFRCMPQVHGATRDGLAHVRVVLEREAMSATDNPLVFADDGDIVSGGNFHGQPCALATDIGKIAIAEIANISERRVEQLVNPHLSSDLPPFLALDSGLNSGFMMAQVTAAALVSENKVLCHPASVDSIPSSAGREDHVSMGAHGARHFAQVTGHVRMGLAVELLVACQALDLRRPLQSTPALEAAHAHLRKSVSMMRVDRPIAPDIVAAEQMLADGSLLAAVQAVVGDLE